MKFNKHEVEYFFTAAEAQMKSFGINKQLSKRDALLPQLPEEVIEECMPLLRIPEADLGTTPYKDLKLEILSIYGKKPQDAFTRAFNRTLEGRPSALGKLLIHDICPGSKPMQGCHCAPMVWGFWHRCLPQSIRVALADKPFDATTYKDVFSHADKVWIANKLKEFEVCHSINETLVEKRTCSENLDSALWG